MRLPKAIRIGWGAIAKIASGMVGSMVSLRLLIFLASREQSSVIAPDVAFESMTLISVSPVCTMPKEAMACITERMKLWVQTINTLTNTEEKLLTTSSLLEGL